MVVIRINAQLNWEEYEGITKMLTRQASHGFVLLPSSMELVATDTPGETIEFEIVRKDNKHG